MEILIVSATEFEIKPILQHFNINTKSNNLFFHNYKNLNISVLITGITYPLLMYKLTKVLNKNKFDLIINAGIAGSYNNNLNTGSIVNVKSEVFSDMIIEDNEKIYTLFEKGLININEFPYINGELINNTIYNNKVINNLPKVKAVTSNTLHGNKVNIEKIKQIFQPDIETMEGAGFFYVCISEKIPFFQIRGISNFVEPLNKEKWDIKTPIININNTILEILDEESNKFE